MEKENERLFITVQGNKIYWEAFIRELDYFRSNISISSSIINSKYCHMIYPLQEITNDWHNGEDELNQNLMEFIKRYGYSEPKEKHLPEVIDELFSQMQTTIYADLTKLLTACVELSDRMYDEYQQDQKEEKERKEKVAQLSEVVLDMAVSAAYDDVSFLCLLQKAKEDDEEYQVKEKEKIATRLFSELIIQKQLSDKITCGQLKSLVSSRFLDEEEITEMLRKEGDKRDAEWYLEDMEGWGMEEETDFNVDDILGFCTDRFIDTIGVRKDFLYSI